jgi:carbon storage regulator CsrA
VLVLKREKGQRIFIGPDIVIEVTGLGDRAVRLGITAPERVKVLREELAELGDPRRAMGLPLPRGAKP